MRYALLLSIALVGLVAPAAAQMGGRHDQHEAEDHWPFHADQPVWAGLIAGLAWETGMRPRDVRAELAGGVSAADVAAEHGVALEDLLASHDRFIDRAMARAVESGRLPQSVADARAAWFKAVAREQVTQGREEPGYPGLHQLHNAIIAGAVEAGELRRRAIVRQLHQCRTLDDILSENGSSGAEAAETALAEIDTLMDGLVSSGQLTPDQRSRWHDSLGTTLLKMTATPGVHVAGKECAPSP